MLGNPCMLGVLQHDPYVPVELMQGWGLPMAALAGCFTWKSNSLTTVMPHLLSGEKDADKRRLLAQLRHLDGNYNGGLRAYLRNSKRLLEDSRLGVQP